MTRGRLCFWRASKFHLLITVDKLPISFALYLLFDFLYLSSLLAALVKPLRRTCWYGNWYLLMGASSHESLSLCQHQARLKHLSYLVLNAYGIQIDAVEEHLSYLFPNGYCMQKRAVEEAKDLVKKPDDALDVKRRQIQCTLVHVDVVIFHLNGTSECPPRVKHLGLMQATSMRMVQQPKLLWLDPT